MRSSVSTLATVFASLAGCLAFFASCADSETKLGPEHEPDGGLRADAGGVGDGSADGGPGRCEGEHATCTAETLPCSEADFCSIQNPISPLYSVNAVWSGDATDVWMVGSSGTIVHWDGAGFHVEPPLTGYTLNAIWGNGADDLWAVSTPDFILRRQWPGGWAKATPITTDPRALKQVRLRAAWGARSGDALVVGGDHVWGQARTRRANSSDPSRTPAAPSRSADPRQPRSRRAPDSGFRGRRSRASADSGSRARAASRRGEPSRAEWRRSRSTRCPASSRRSRASSTSLRAPDRKISEDALPHLRDHRGRSNAGDARFHTSKSLRSATASRTRSARQCLRL